MQNMKKMTISQLLNDYANMLNAADVMKTCKNMKKMIKTQVL